MAGWWRWRRRSCGGCTNAFKRWRRTLLGRAALPQWAQGAGPALPLRMPGNQVRRVAGPGFCGWGTSMKYKQPLCVSTTLAPCKRDGRCSSRTSAPARHPVRSLGRSRQVTARAARPVVQGSTRGRWRRPWRMPAAWALRACWRGGRLGKLAPRHADRFTTVRLLHALRRPYLFLHLSPKNICCFPGTLDVLQQHVCRSPGLPGPAPVRQRRAAAHLLHHTQRVAAALQLPARRAAHKGFFVVAPPPSPSPVPVAPACCRETHTHTAAPSYTATTLAPPPPPIHTHANPAAPSRCTTHPPLAAAGPPPLELADLSEAVSRSAAAVAVLHFTCFSPEPLPMASRRVLCAFPLPAGGDSCSAVERPGHVQASVHSVQACPGGGEGEEQGPGRGPPGPYVPQRPAMLHRQPCSPPPPPPPRPKHHTPPPPPLPPAPPPPSHPTHVRPPPTHTHMCKSGQSTGPHHQAH